MSNRGICSICAGEKVLLTGETCGCEDGTAVGEMHFLRTQLFKQDDELRALLTDLSDCKTQIKNLSAERDALRDTISRVLIWAKHTDDCPIWIIRMLQSILNATLSEGERG